MSKKSQKQNMNTITRLLSTDLSFIYGERESDPNGAKKMFLSKSAAFLRTLGKDLGLRELKVQTNAGGIAVSGDVTLYGMWGDGNGLYFKITEPLSPLNAFLYRHIKSMKDFTGGQNQWLPCTVFEDEDYQQLFSTLLALKKQPEGMRNAV